MAGWLSLRTSKPEMRPFTKEEFRVLIDSLPRGWQPYFQFAVWSGLRPGEQAALQWSDVDLKSRPAIVEVRATLDSRKSGQRHSPKTPESANAVELVPQAVEAIEMQLRQQAKVSPWVFTAPAGGAVNVANLTRRVYYPALHRTNLIARPLYTLRHTFDVFMLQAGESPGWVSRQMRHTSVEMLRRRYARWWPRMSSSDGSKSLEWWSAS